uniref:Putative secreted protein n=1 Tax=Anopheles marajoara TaxID=58244 RepID=A0A2M4C8A7_9DIPT
MCGFALKALERPRLTFLSLSLFLFFSLSRCYCVDEDGQRIFGEAVHTASIQISMRCGKHRVARRRRSDGDADADDGFIPFGSFIFYFLQNAHDWPRKPASYSTPSTRC